MSQDNISLGDMLKPKRRDFCKICDLLLKEGAEGVEYKDGFYCRVCAKKRKPVKH